MVVVQNCISFARSEHPPSSVRAVSAREQAWVRRLQGSSTLLAKGADPRIKRSHMMTTGLLRSCFQWRFFPEPVKKSFWGKVFCLLYQKVTPSEIWTITELVQVGCWTPAVEAEGPPQNHGPPSVVSFHHSHSILVVFSSFLFNQLFINNCSIFKVIVVFSTFINFLWAFKKFLLLQPENRWEKINWKNLYGSSEICPVTSGQRNVI